MSNAFVRVQEGADRTKGWDAEEVLVDGLKVYRQRVVAVPSSVDGATPVGKGALRIDSVDSNTLYVGKAIPGATETSTVWQIKKILTSGSNMSILYPEGSGNYAYSWADRASYTYR